jgi:hypothetical protein
LSTASATARYGLLDINDSKTWNSGYLLASFKIWGKYWFRVGKNEKNIALRLFISEKHDLSENKISVRHAQL